MPPLELDPRYTFDTFVIGAANRLAAAAARRVAESPGNTYNPLFLYSPCGLGKTHLVTAVGNHARRVHPGLTVLYDTLDHLVEEAVAAVQAGQRDAFRNKFRDTRLLLLDDVQFLTGRQETQEELLRAWDALSARGGQIVLASDRPPGEINGIDQRLLSRFSGGLIVDLGAPDYETRVAILRRKAEERGQALASGVAELLARDNFANVRELQGALNRLIAVQELQGRPVTAAEAPAVIGGAVVAKPGGSEFDALVSGMTGTLSEVAVQSAAERQLTEAVARWQKEGYRALRLELALANPLGLPDDVEGLVRRFESDVERLREIALQIAALDAESPELARVEVLRDPERIPEAEALLEDVRDRARPLPSPPPGFSFEMLMLPRELLAVRAALAAAEQPGERHNPLVIYGPPGAGKTALLAAFGQALRARDPNTAIAYVQGPNFAAELIEALERNRTESWRTRYRRATALLLDDIDALAQTERAQDELFHLLDALLRARAQIAVTATLPPQQLFGLEDRVRSRLESGLVVELPDPAAAFQEWARRREREEGLDQGAEPAGAGGTGLATTVLGRRRSAEVRDDWFLSREKIVWTWPYLGDWLVEELQ